MKSNMEDIDQLIKDTLSEEESKFYDSLEEQNVFGMVTGLFTGKNKWIIIVMNIMTFIFFGLFIYCAIKFFDTSETNELIKWGIGSLVYHYLEKFPNNILNY